MNTLIEWIYTQACISIWIDDHIDIGGDFFRRGDILETTRRTRNNNTLSTIDDHHKYFWVSSKEYSEKVAFDKFEANSKPEGIFDLKNIRLDFGWLDLGVVVDKNVKIRANDEILFIDFKLENLK